MIHEKWLKTGAGRDYVKKFFGDNILEELDKGRLASILAASGVESAAAE